MQTELQVQTRAELLEQQNQFLIQQFEAAVQIEHHKNYIKSLRADIKELDKQLGDLRVKLESSQLTLGVK